MPPAWKTDEMTRYTGTVMAIDPSGKGKDETAYAIVRYSYGFLFLVASGGFTDGYSETTMKSSSRCGRSLPHHRSWCLRKTSAAACSPSC
jgi:hypothetical protein